MRLRERPATAWVVAHLCALLIILLAAPEWFVVTASVAALLSGLMVARNENALHRTLAEVRRRLGELAATSPDSPANIHVVLEQISQVLSTGRARIDATETKYRALVEQAEVAIYIHDGNRFLDVNDSACELFGYDRDELLQTPVAEVFTDHPDPAAEKPFDRRPPGRQPDRRTHHRRKDGSIVPVEVSTTIVSVAGKRSALSIVRDITERLRTEESRDRSREQLQLVADNIPSLISLVDRQQRYQFVNRAYARWFQRFDSDLVGRAVKDVLDEATYRNARPHIERTLAGSNSVFQHTIYDRSGRACHFLATYVPHRQRGQVVGYVALEHDITELESATVRVRESEARYRQLVESSPYCIHEIDPDGVLRSVNSAGVRMMGKTRDTELIGSNFLHCAAPEDVDALRAHIEAAMHGRGDELEYLTRDGHTFASSLTPLFDAHNRVHGLMGIVRDITEQKRVAARRQEAEEEGRRHLANLQALSARLESIREEERKHISREIHDELGQLLTGLKMELAGLEKQVVALPPETRGCLEERVIEAGDLADRTIRSVREIAMRIRPSVLDELGLIAALKHECTRFREHSSIDCSFTTAGEIPDLDDDVATALFRLCQEFLTNIARHAGGQRAAVGLSYEADQLVLTVTDDGIGIPDNAEVVSGHLGLVGARERVHNLHGSLQLDGSPGGGTVVTVRVPLNTTLPTEHEDTDR